jgi:PBP1b-binding outer membrane lipoprotein LpoB
MTRLLAIAAALLLGACVGEPMTQQEVLETQADSMKEGRGFLSGDDGEFVIIGE